MGFLDIMKEQENPDGLEGHLQRLFWQEVSKQEPKKKKFTKGNPAFKTHTVPLVTKAQQKELDIQYMTENCEYHKRGCQVINCWNCKRKENMEMEKEKRKINEHKLSLAKVRKTRDEWRTIDMNREDYWKMEIAFECPITKKKHTITDCFERCDMWGRTYQDIGEGRIGAILHCCFVSGEKELHSGNPTRFE
jgi:hypothetical protein